MINLLLDEIEKYSEKYTFSFQFWGKGNNNVYIEKNDVELTSSGGFETIEEVLKFALGYIYKINRVPNTKRVF